jgi:hypothetical protein
MGMNFGDLPEISGAISIMKEWQYKNRQILCKLFFEKN